MAKFIVEVDNDDEFLEYVPGIITRSLTYEGYNCTSVSPEKKGD